MRSAVIADLWSVSPWTTSFRMRRSWSISEAIDFSMVLSRATTDLSPIKVGSTRAKVEGVLGESVKSKQTDSGKIDTYKYNKGARQGGLPEDPNWAFIALLASPIIHGIKYEGQREDIEVAYGPDDTVVRIGWPPGSIAEERTKLLVAAEKGDRDAQFSLAWLSWSVDERRKWLCLAANQGKGEAQIEMGLEKEFGHDLYERDPVGAYMWYSLAIAQGNDWVVAFRDRLAKKMTPAQIAEAEKLAAEWKPGDCGAEGSPTKSPG